MTAIFRATATAAFFRPLHLAIRSPPALSADHFSTRVRGCGLGQVGPDERIATLEILPARRGGNVPYLRENSSRDYSGSKSTGTAPMIEPLSTNLAAVSKSRAMYRST